VSAQAPTIKPSTKLSAARFKWRALPWWALLLLILGIVAVAAINRSVVYSDAWEFLKGGIPNTLRLTVTAYAVALVLGLVVGLGRTSKNVVISNIATLYVEVIRGVPLIVVLLYIAFVAAGPLAVQLSNAAKASTVPLLATSLQTVADLMRIDFFRGVLGLAVGYAAYLSEVYRAGIEGIPRGQTEAARSLGMSQGQAMFYIILPQAIRIVLPPLANDFIAMLKDSALVSAIGGTVDNAELTLRGRMYASSTFRSFEVYNMVALLYLVMSLVGSVVVRFIERRFSVPK
jgi:polar amino acid transport system permease protein